MNNLEDKAQGQKSLRTSQSLKLDIILPTKNIHPEILECK